MQCEKGRNAVSNWLAEGLFLIIVLGGITWYELAAKNTRGEQDKPNTTPLGEIILSTLASSLFAGILVALPLQVLFHPPVLLVALLSAIAVLAIYILPARKIRVRRHR